MIGEIGNFNMKKLLLILLCLPMIGFGQCISGNCKNGKGNKTYDGGKNYVGEFKNYKWHGQGTATFANGSTFTGRWKENIRNGYGVSTWSNGNKYAGEWRADDRNGQGTFTWYNGDKYVGEWKNDKMNGQGTLSWDNGDKYVGEWKDGEKSGQGTYTWPNGNKYVGEWKDGEKSGQGTLSWANGEKYVGEWKDGEKSGQGTFTYANGEKYNGKWIEGERVIPRATKPANLIVNNIEFKDYNSNNLLEANETADLIFTLNNIGKGPAYSMSITVQENRNISGLNYKKTYQVPSLEPGENKQIIIPITAAMNLETGEASFNIQVSEGNGFNADPTDVSISTQAFIPPKVEIVDYLFSSATGVIKPMTEVNLQFAVQNTGQGTAYDIKINMQIPANVFSGAGNKYAINKLAAGEQRVFDFSFFTNKLFKKNKLNITADISESLHKYASDKTMSVKMEEDISNTQSLTITSDVTIKNIKIDRFSLNSSVDKNIPVNSKVNNRFALVIGNEDYSTFQTSLQSEQNVDYAVNDATIFKKYCLNTLGIKEENMFSIINATAGEMSQEIDLITKLVKKTGKKSELIVYYAGHGYPDELTKVPYLIPVDVSAANLTTAIKLDDFYQKLANTNASKITIFLDACFTGGGRNSGLIASRGVTIKPKEGSLSGNIVVFSASSAEQSSLPYHDEGHGMFTYFLLKKFQESKGNVTLGELSEYLNDNVSIKSLRVNQKEQDPKVNTSSKVVNDWKNWKF